METTEKPEVKAHHLIRCYFCHEVYDKRRARQTITFDGEPADYVCPKCGEFNP